MQRTPGGAGDGTATTDGALLSIGAVLAQLRDEFPEVTISKIRFLEAEGLVEPQRTPSGYRKFAARDVQRLAYVLRVQRDHYLPLRVIKEHLEGLDRGEQPVLPGRSGGEVDPRPPDDPEAALHAPQELRMGRAELLAATGADAAELDQWESYGLVEAGGDGGYDAETVVIGRLIADLGRYGLEPRHLRAVKAAAEREAGLVEQLVAPLRRHRNPQTRRHAEVTAEELAELSVRLHAAMVRSALRLRLR
ncbi:transcriptional regulator FtsR [Actinacidiphila paucisporea]|uniref:MerR family regulatory protein n=1 Tax=Actinacidiphila paucisporea TaxID=310782 RepID=A0A1M7R080_9ACTN|nr:MerR family transcriptional regulator [Actinacidiphila paucisporea]SHN37803.1 MerR family regulatory protein [Actinacidiphila paucisporea]